MPPAVCIVPVDDDPLVCANLVVDGKTYPIASINHLLAYDDAQLAYKGPLFASLYQDADLNPRQIALVRNTLNASPRYFDLLYKRIHATTSYTVLFHDQNPALTVRPLKTRKRK